MFMKFHKDLNPSSVAIYHRLAKNLNLRGDRQKMSYEFRTYESVDEKSLSLAISRKTTKKEFERIKVKRDETSKKQTKPCNLI